MEAVSRSRDTVMQRPYYQVDADVLSAPYYN